MNGKRMRNSVALALIFTLLLVGVCFAQTALSDVVGIRSPIMVSNGVPLRAANSKVHSREQHDLCRHNTLGSLKGTDDTTKESTHSNTGNNTFWVEKGVPAALIGFMAAILGGFIQSLFSLYLAKRAEREKARIAYREKVSDLADRLGASSYQLLASCDIFLKKWAKHGPAPYPQSDQEESFRKSVQKWLQNASDNALELRKLRYLSRYKLFGMDDAIKTLTRVNNWITHYKKNVDEGRKFLEKADELRKTIDQVLMEVIDSGNRPTEKMLRKIRAATQALKLQHKKTDPECEEEACDDFSRADI